MHKSRFLFFNDDGDFQEGMSAGIFITDVQPQDGADVVTVTNVPNVIGNSIVQSVECDTELVEVYVEWDGTAYHYNGDVTINGIAIPIENVSEIDNTRRFRASIDIDLDGATEIIALHEDGAYSKVDVTLQGAGPEITDVNFINGYPGTQTEVKQGDTFDLEIHFNPSGAIPSHVEVSNFGALSSGTFDLSGTELDWGTIHKATITCTIDSTSNTVQALSALVQGRNSFGTFGDSVNSNDGGGSINGTDLINCNDVTPNISFGDIIYASGFDALKNSETADIEFNYSECDSIAFSSPNSQLSIADDAVLEATKTVTRIAGDYNVSTNNLRAIGHRVANDTNTTINDVVFIANIQATITVAEQSSRLVSGGNDGTTAQDHTITIGSSQRLSELPTLSAPEGSLGAFSGSLNGTSFTATISIHDDDINGVYTWTSLNAINLAGLVTNVISGNDTYEIGGFVERDIFFSAQSIEENLGVSISDPSKVVAVDKDLIAMTYYADLADHSRGYSFTEPSMVQNPNGNILFWNDVIDRENNTTGLSFIRLREDA